jgi:hypothetical protein
MPILHTIHTLAGGATVRFLLKLGQADLMRRRQARMPIPGPEAGIALLDPGAECTCVDPSLVAKLSLPFSSSNLLVTPGWHSGPAALGGAVPQISHEGGLEIIHPDSKQNLVVPVLEIEAISLSSFGIDAIIGRDILASCVMVYDGPAGSVTLAY